MIVDLVIPALNEEVNIPSLLSAVPRGVFRHIIVVDNGSTDRTAELAAQRGAIVVREKQRGYGAACLAGLRWIDERGDAKNDTSAAMVGQVRAVAFIDADLADDPAQLPALCEAVANDDADLVIGCRHQFADAGALDWHQRFGNWLACKLIAIATGRRYSDLGPMRVIRRRSLQTIAMTDRTWGWTVEMQYKAAVMGLRTVEIDVPYRKRQAGKSKISGSLIGSVRAGTRILLTVGQLWWRYGAGDKPRSNLSGQA